MAWISVHEQVLGKKLRLLSKDIGCSQNEALGILVRMWLYAINGADKFGYFAGASEDDIAEVLSIGLNKSLDERNVVEVLKRNGWIDFEDGLHIHDWEEWQEYWYKAVTVRENNAKRQREYRKAKKESTKKEKPKKDQPVEAPEEPAKEKEAGYPKSFEDFWSAYPRKVGKGEAYKKYCARLKDGWREEELLEAAMAYANRCSIDRTEEKYIKHGKTFLSENTPFADFLKKKEVICHEDNDDPYAEWRQ